jgi:hypothetical protein
MAVSGSSIAGSPRSASSRSMEEDGSEPAQPVPVASFWGLMRRSCPGDRRSSASPSIVLYVAVQPPNAGQGAIGVWGVNVDGRMLLASLILLLSLVGGLIAVVLGHLGLGRVVPCASRGTRARVVERAAGLSEQPPGGRVVEWAGGRVCIEVLMAALVVTSRHGQYHKAPRGSHGTPRAVTRCNPLPAVVCLPTAAAAPTRSSGEH